MGGSSSRHLTKGHYVDIKITNPVDWNPVSSYTANDELIIYGKKVLKSGDEGEENAPELGIEEMIGKLYQQRQSFMGFVDSVNKVGKFMSNKKLTPPKGSNYFTKLCEKVDVKSKLPYILVKLDNGKTIRLDKDGSSRKSKNSFGGETFTGKYANSQILGFAGFYGPGISNISSFDDFVIQ